MAATPLAPGRLQSSTTAITSQVTSLFPAKSMPWRFARGVSPTAQLLVGSDGH